MVCFDFQVLVIPPLPPYVSTSGVSGKVLSAEFEIQRT